jgi:hypothetical protein
LDEQTLTYAKETHPITLFADGLDVEGEVYLDYGRLFQRKSGKIVKMV